MAAHRGGDVTPMAPPRPGDPGTKRYVEKHGDRRVAVRYRYDEQASKRYTTVEIVVDERPWAAAPVVPDPDRPVGLRIEYGEESLRRAGYPSATRRFIAGIRYSLR
jgi:hypothetical protein